MAYKLYGREMFTADVNGEHYVFTCYGQSTNYGFRHICCLGYSNTDVAKYVRDDIIAKACYYNRTWESFRYETVLNRAINNLDVDDDVKQQLTNILIHKIKQEEHEKCEKQVEQFANLFNGLSEENKQHIRNGLGENGIQTEEQANTVMTVMKMMSVLQGT